MAVVRLASVEVITLVLAAACSRHEAEQQDCRPSEFGYAESTLNRSVLEQASTEANSVLAPGIEIRAWPSWTERPSSGKPVPIFIIDDSSLPRSDVAFSPNGKTCLFMSRRFLARFVELFGSDGVDTFDVAPEHALGIVLLHELGHFQNGDAGIYSPPFPLTAEDLPLKLTEAKNTELRADRFAGEQLGAALQAKDARLLAAAPLLFALTHISWNLEKFRLVDNTGATVLGLPSVIGDAGYSHPNLELRFLVIDYVSSDQGNKALVLKLMEDFLSHRGYGGEVLWKTPD